MGTWPSGQPQWEIADLQSLAINNQLFGVSPYVLSGVAQNESGWEVRGAGINSEGYGGFYGLGQNSKYSFGGSSFQDTPTELHDPSSASFILQSETAAAEIASLLSSYGGNLNEAISAYVSGGTGDLNNADYEDALSYLGSGQAATGSTTAPINSTGATPNGANATLASDSTSSTPTQPTQQPGIAGVLQDLDSALNPHSSNPLSSIEDTILLIASRGLFTVLFLGVTLAGIYMLVKKPVNAGAGVLTNYVVPQQRIAQAGRRLSIAESTEARRAARPATAAAGVGLGQ